MNICYVRQKWYISYLYIFVWWEFWVPMNGNMSFIIVFLLWPTFQRNISSNFQFRQQFQSPIEFTNWILTDQRVVNMLINILQTVDVHRRWSIIRVAYIADVVKLARWFTDRKFHYKKNSSNSHPIEIPIHISRPSLTLF